MDEETLRRKLARERAARLQAEQIAEQSLADLYQANLALDQRVREATADLEHALARAQTADAAKAAFLQGIAHRTGSPLHVIQGFIELVARDISTGRIHDAASAAAVEARRLGRAFEVLLEMSQAVSEELAVQPIGTTLEFAVRRILDRRLPETLALGRVLDLRISGDPQMRLLVDLVRVEQVLDSMVDNAIEHGSGTIRVGLAVAPTSDRTASLEIVVADEGAGVAAHLGSTVFDAFVAGDGHTGFGVGLTLARTIAAAMGGTIVLDEEVPSRFVATIPVAIAGMDGPTVDREALRRLRAEIPLPGFMERLSETFLRSAEGWIARLATADDEEARAIAHQASSSAKQLGLRGIGTLAKRVELHDGVTGAPELARALEASAAPLRRAIAEVVAEDDSQGHERGDGRRPAAERLT